MSKIGIDGYVKNTFVQAFVFQPPGVIQTKTVIEQVGAEAEADTGHRSLLVRTGLVVCAQYPVIEMGVVPCGTDVRKSYQLQAVEERVEQVSLEKIADKGETYFGIPDEKTVAVTDVLVEPAHVGG